MTNRIIPVLCAIVLIGGVYGPAHAEDAKPCQISLKDAFDIMRKELTERDDNNPKSGSRLTMWYMSVNYKIVITADGKVVVPCDGITLVTDPRFGECYEETTRKKPELP